MNILNDIKTVVKTASAIRKARKNGSDSVKVTVQPVRNIPLIKPGYWGATMESCLFFNSGELGRKIRDIFYTFDTDTQHAMTFTPKDKGWVARARFWQKALKPVLPSAQYYTAMERITGHYVRCLKRRIDTSCEKKGCQK